MGTMKNKLFGISVILVVLFALCACAATTATASTVTEVAAVPAEQVVEQAKPVEQAVETKATKSSFHYVHDPRENAEAMKDIIENPNAVYGFSPDPNSTRLGAYASYDWTDPVFVESARKERIAYHESLNTMVAIMSTMAADGKSEERIAKAVSAERNRLRLALYENDPKTLADIKKSNLATYGHEDGPTAYELFEKYGSWKIVIQKAFSPNLGMDVICGLFDEYYPLYVMLGYAY